MEKINDASFDHLIAEVNEPAIDEVYKCYKAEADARNAMFKDLCSIKVIKNKLSKENKELQARVQYLENELATLTGECDPVVFPDGADEKDVITYILMCAQKWMPSARIIGNARAGDIARAMQQALSKIN